jgi:hypothetical protein
VLFDGNAGADGQTEAGAKSLFDEMAGNRKLLTVLADPTKAAKLSASYANPGVGDIFVGQQGAATAKS